MAKLITKFRYYKPHGKTKTGGLANYIATREGVEENKKNIITSPATPKQKDFILKLLEDYPDCAEMLEYEDYVKEPTKENASEFITRALEDNANTAIFNKTYADYIATRPGVEKHASHGLFTNLDEKIDLSTYFK